MGKQQSYLAINDLMLKILLGLTKQERVIKQKILLNLKINFPNLPEASTTDEINDTICYDDLIGKIKKHCEKKEYKLIEYATHDLYKFIKKNIPKRYKIKLSLEKNPSIPNLKSANFVIEDI